MDTWKSGAPSESLANQTPKLFVGDEDWSSGCALKNYELVGDAEPFGNNVRFLVDLNLTSKTGEPLQKKVRYVVATDPVFSVTRDDRPE